MYNFIVPKAPLRDYSFQDQFLLKKKKEKKINVLAIYPTINSS